MKSVADKTRKEEVVILVMLNLCKRKERKREASCKEEMVKD